jgi:hypothetical protein
MQFALVALAAHAIVSSPPPKVTAPAGFKAPEPRPLQMTRPMQEQLPGLLTGSAVLAIRLATGVFTLGWTPKLVSSDQ